MTTYSAPVTEWHWAKMLDRAQTGAGLTSLYQSVVDVRRGAVVGYAALARFFDYPVLDPATWFSTARDHGRLPALEAAALRSALRTRESLPDGAFLSVKVSGEALASPEVHGVLAESRSLDGLVLEVSSVGGPTAYAAVQRALERWREAGARLAMADTGSGTTSTRALLAANPEVIRLDQAVVRRIDRDPARRAHVEMLRVLADRMDAWLLAEGVETAGELNAITGLGVHLAQGYFLARPSSGWETVDEFAAATLREAGAALDTTLRPLLEVPAAVTHAADAYAALGEGDHDLAVVVDVDHRPLATVDASGRQRDPGALLDVETDRRAAARLLAARGEAWAEPVVVVDAAGRYAGVVRVERLLAALAG